MDYSLKRGFKPDLERIQKALEEEFPTRGFKPDLERISQALKEEFPVEIKQEDGKLLLGYRALKSICVSIKGKKLNVTTESDLARFRRGRPGHQQALSKLPGKGNRLYRQAEAADGQKRGQGSRISLDFAQAGREP